MALNFCKESISGDINSHAHESNIKKVSFQLLQSDMNAASLECDFLLFMSFQFDCKLHHKETQRLQGLIITRRVLSEERGWKGWVESTIGGAEDFRNAWEGT